MSGRERYGRWWRAKKRFVALPRFVALRMPRRATEHAAIMRQ
ncbi:hypothetical protein LC55x_5041 [Lysobacter capsici]|nr:hypothetical protein LC55x_5041 [Lysobacter capsici]